MSATPTSALSFQNFFSATLSSDITASSTDIPLDNIPNGVEGFLVIDPDTSSREVIFYTSKTALKVVCPSVGDGRGQDDTVAGAHLQGTTVIMAPVAAYFEALVTLFTTTPQGYTSLAGTFTAVTNNGNRSFTMSTSTDQTSVLSPGARVRFTRNTAAPTQCTSLNGTNQYYSKSSPAGMTFTDDFVVSAWVKVSSYATGVIASRYNGTSGWQLYMSSTGQVYLIGLNGGAVNVSGVSSYQSLPLNKWVHVTAQLDMSTFTATTTTSYVMIDGVDVPATVSRGGTNPTALIQAGNLEIGSGNAGSFFPGKIAQAAVFSAKVTQAQMRTYMSQGLSGTETSLVSAYSFNNSINDLNANANHLTANGSAVATNADSPFGNSGVSSTLEYGIVTALTSSTMTVQVPEGCAIPTSGTIAAAAYSLQKAPYGFPVSENKWDLIAKYNSSISTAIGGVNAWFASVCQLPLTVGAWKPGYSGPLSQSSTVAASRDGRFLMSPATPTNGIYTDDLSAIVYTASSLNGVIGMVAREKKDAIDLTTQTTYILYGTVTVASGTETWLVRGDTSSFVVYGKFALL